MDQPGTVLTVAQDAAEWADTLDLLSNQCGYRVLAARSPADARAALADAHVDLVIAEDGGSGDGLVFLSGLRLSHPDIIRVLALDAEASLAGPAMAPAAIYQFVRKPLDAEQVGLVVKRALETRELARRHRLLSREFKFSGDRFSSTTAMAIRSPPRASVSRSSSMSTRRWSSSVIWRARRQGRRCRS